MSSFSINTNNNAMAALRTLNQTNQSLTQVQGRINSGLAVGGAKDNASTFAIAQGMRGDIAGLKQVQSTLQLGETTVNVALAAAERISSKLNEMKGKIVDGQAKNLDAKAIQSDINSIADQITDMAAAAQFNGVNLINSTDQNKNLTVLSSLNRTSATAVTVDSIEVKSADMSATGLSVSGLNVEKGYSEFSLGSSVTIAENKQLTFSDGTTDYTFVFNDVTNGTAATGPAQTTGQKTFFVDYDPAESALTSMDKMAKAINAQGFNASLDAASGALKVSSGQVALNSATTDVAGLTGADVTTAGPAAALTSIENAINVMKENVARLGTNANQLSTQKDFVKALKDSLESGVGDLVDADLAEESAKLQALQTKQQLGMQALSIANQGPSAVMSLFR